MLKGIRDRIGGAGLIVAVCALVLALAGGAYAAVKLNAKQKKEVKSIATSVAKKLVVPGPPGPAGPGGPAGKNGTNGTNGEDGEDGTDGEDGKSIEMTPIAAGLAECQERGGVELEREGEPSTAKEICNGKEGKDGKEGSPWTVGGMLPAGAAETGAWGFQLNEGEAFAPISFPIRLKSGPEYVGLNEPTNKAHYSTETNFKDFDANAGNGVFGCNGSVGVPKAPPGHLCVYQATLTSATFNGLRNLGNSAGLLQAPGALIRFTVTATGARGAGSFSVKGACAEGEEIVKDSEAEAFEWICHKP